jgi:uncharacterized protein
MPAQNILSLDGGGSWAILEAMALGELYGYDTPGHAVLANFMLAAANSGGSIVLAGLALNWTPRDLINQLNSQELREKIFVRNFFHLPDLERYRTGEKLDGLREVFRQTPNAQFADQPLEQIQSPCKLLIASFNYDRLRADFFRSDADSPAATSVGSAQPTLTEAVHASTNAPIKYFDAPAEMASRAYAGCRYWDGAMAGFNNPVMAAITEAMAYGVAPTDMRVLSLGTANVFLPMPNPLPSPGASGQNHLCVPICDNGVMRDLSLAASAILEDPPDSASFIAHLLVSGAGAVSQNPSAPVMNGNLVRLNPWIQPVGSPHSWRAPSLLAHAADARMTPPNSVPQNYRTDDAVFDALVNLDMDAVEQADVDLVTTLGRSWIAGDAPNQAIRANHDLRPLIGHGKFSAAAAQARAIGLA